MEDSSLEDLACYARPLRLAAIAMLCLAVIGWVARGVVAVEVHLQGLKGSQATTLRPSQIAYLVRVLESDAHARVRLRAVALVDPSDPQSLPVLVLGLADADAEVRQRATTAIHRSPALRRLDESSRLVPDAQLVDLVRRCANPEGRGNLLREMVQSRKSALTSAVEVLLQSSIPPSAQELTDCARYAERWLGASERGPYLRLAWRGVEHPDPAARLACRDCVMYGDADAITAQQVLEWASDSPQVIHLARRHIALAAAERLPEVPILPGRWEFHAWLSLLDYGSQLIPSEHRLFLQLVRLGVDHGEEDLRSFCRCSVARYDVGALSEGQLLEWGADVAWKHLEEVHVASWQEISITPQDSEEIEALLLAELRRRAPAAVEEAAGASLAAAERRVAAHIVGLLPRLLPASREEAALRAGLLNFDESAREPIAAQLGSPGFQRRVREARSQGEGE